jgi:transposase
VVDNASTHTREAFEDRISYWQARGLSIFRLPLYSPHLNLVEIVWRFIKYEWIEFWAYLSFEHLVKYVEHILANWGTKYQINFV